MRMKHRLTGGLLMAFAVALAACTPTDAGADDESAAPSVEVAPSVEAAPADVSPTPVPDPDEY
jgi:hypothetical protein